MFIFLLSEHRLYILKNVCVCVCVCVCVYVYIYICMYTHISDCIEAVYELSLLPNNTASDICVLKSGAVRSVNWIFIIRAPTWR